MKLGFLKEMNPFRLWARQDETEEYYALDNYSLNEYFIHFTSDHKTGNPRTEKLVKKVTV